MKKNGFTLVEVMIVIAIIAIIVSIATLNFKDMKGKADTEKQTLQLQADISNVRLNAMQNKQRSVMLFDTKQYIYKTYSSDNESLDDGDEVNTASFRNDIKLTFESAPLRFPDVKRVEFDSRGYTNMPTTTIVIMPITNNGGLNCIEVQTARTSIGRMENDSTCRKQ